MRINFKHITVLFCFLMTAGTGTLPILAQTPAPSVTVTAGDPGDLDCGDTATAPASASLSNPPTGQNEATLTQHWTWSISTGDSSTVYIEHPDASSTTYHCEHDDPGDYSIQVTASVTLHDPATGTDYGPYSGSDTFGDSDSNPSSPSAASASRTVTNSSQMSPHSSPGSKRYPARLHFTVTNKGKIHHDVLTHYYNPKYGVYTWGYRDLWRLGTLYTKSGLFTRGLLSESFSAYTYSYNPHWAAFFSNPPVAAPPAPHPNGYIEDTNHVEINKDTTPDTYWFTVDQHFANQGPDGPSDNYHTDRAEQPTSYRTAH